MPELNRAVTAPGRSRSCQYSKISARPTVENVHTPRERLSVPLVNRLALFLEELLGEL
jgi:di/tripeptidase